MRATVLRFYHVARPRISPRWFLIPDRDPHNIGDTQVGNERFSEITPSFAASASFPQSWETAQITKIEPLEAEAVTLPFANGINPEK